MSATTKLIACLDAMVADGHLSRAQAEDALSDVNRAVRKNAETMMLPAAELQAVKDVLAERAATAKRQKYLIAKQVEAQTRIKAAADAHPKGMVAGFLSWLTKDHTGFAKNPNVEYRAHVIRAALDQAGLDLFEKMAPTKLGWSEDTAGLRDVVRELYGTDTGSPRAKAAAKAFSQAAEAARNWFNDVGGDIGRLETWRLPQSHDQVRITQAGFENWAKAVDAAGGEILDNLGNPLRGIERQTVLRDVYETLSTGGLNKIAPGSGTAGTKLANKGGKSRVLHFTDADGWLNYHQEFGTGSLYSTFAGHVHLMARDIAALDVLGPNPAATVRWMADLAKRQKPASDRAITRTWAALAGAQGSVASGWRRYLYSGLQNTRNLLRSAQMGSATLSAVTDLSTIQAAATWSGLDTSRALAFYAKQLNPASAADRQFARRHGLIADMTSRAMNNSRVVDEDMGRGLTARIADTVFSLSGLTQHTNAARTAFQLESMATLADHAGKSWNDLPAPFRSMLERGGMDQPRWDVARNADLLDHGGVKFMDPVDMTLSADKATREAGLRLHQAILQETDYAVPQPDARIRGVMNFGAEPGTLLHELVKTAAMYRSYPVTVTMTLASRYYNGAAATGRSRSKVVMMAGATMVSMTALGALALQNKQIAGGRDPRDMNDPSFWAQAAFQGGGLGIMGDFMSAATARTDKDLASTVAGTGFGLLSDVLNLTTRNAMAEAEGRASNSAYDLVNFLQRYTPGSNLWWAKTATDRLFWAQLKLLADPETPSRFALMEKKAQRDYGQRFWARPGRMLPDRAPDLTAAWKDE